MDKEEKKPQPLTNEQRQLIDADDEDMQSGKLSGNDKIKYPANPTPVKPLTEAERKQYDAEGAKMYGFDDKGKPIPGKVNTPVLNENDMLVEKIKYANEPGSDVKFTDEEMKMLKGASDAYKGTDVYAKKNPGPWGDKEPLDWMMEQMSDSYQLKSKEEIEAARKRERRNALIRSLGDGIGALSNLYFTTKGAPNVKQGETMTGTGEKNFEKRLKEWNDDRKEYLGNVLKILEAKRLQQKTDQEGKYSGRKAQAQIDYWANLFGLKKDESDRDFNYKKEQDKKEQERKDEEEQRKQKESDERIADRKRRTAIYGSDVSNKNQNRNAKTAQGVRGSSGNQGSHTIDWYDDNGVHHVDRAPGTQQRGGTVRKKPNPMKSTKK